MCVIIIKFCLNLKFENKIGKIIISEEFMFILYVKLILKLVPTSEMYIRKKIQSVEFTITRNNVLRNV